MVPPRQESRPASERNGRPLVIGLTGGIGSGKSTVADAFGALGVPVFDADRIARELVEPGQPALDEITELFGRRCLAPDGHLDRAWLRNRVFSDAALRRRLEEILHPRIRRRIREYIDAAHAPYCVAVIPLLLETGQTDLVDRILVVDAPESSRISRVIARDRLSRDTVTAILQSQTDRESRLAAADDILVNDRDHDTLIRQVRMLHNRFLQASRMRE
ncbi:MAG: dephospho-CoA kinase [Gammaproteobacteria bacterium]